MYGDFEEGSQWCEGFLDFHLFVVKMILVKLDGDAVDMLAAIVCDGHTGDPY